jgi:predicted nucleic acid-binding protein
VLGDSSGIYSSLDGGDRDFRRAIEFVLRKDVELVLPDAAIEELYALMRKRMGASAAMQVATAFLDGQSGTVIPQTEQDRAETWALLKTYMGIPLSYVDASIIVLGRRLGFSDVFTFDDDFRMAGMTMVP